MKKFSLVILIVSLLVIFTAGLAAAQSSGELQLGLNRDWGYGGFGNDIQGLFTVKVKNPPADLTKVVFLIDGNSMGEDTESPFSLQFNTDSYPLGVHTISATGITSSGAQLSSNLITSEFVPASSPTKMIGSVLLPILGLIVLIAILSFVIPLVLNKGKASATPLGAPRKYGVGGGAICPKCARPFPLKLWWINLGWNKIDRCPYCGKWSFVRPRSISELRAAEAAELVGVKSDAPGSMETEAEQLNKNLDDSKYQDI